MGRPKSLKNNGLEGQTDRRPKGLPKERTPARQLLQPTSPTGALASDASRLRVDSPIGRPGPKTLLPTLTPHLRPETRRKPAYRSSPTGTASTDWSHPTGDSRSEGTRGERRKQRTKSKYGTRTIPCTPVRIVLHNRPNTSSMGGSDSCVYSIVGADIYVYSIVGTIGAPVRQKGPHMPLGIDSGHQDSPYLVHVVGLLIY